MNLPIIHINRLYKSFGSQQVLKNINLEIDKGRTTVILGRSGGGKSVLLKHIIGLMKPDAGNIFFEGKDIAKLKISQLNEVRKRFGMLFQEAALFDSMNVYENVAFPIREHGKHIPEKEIKKIVSEKLEAVGLYNVEKKMPSQLSGGMRKRVGLARAIALNPEIVLFDEPTTGLDPIMTNAINQLIYDTQEKFHLTYIVISHDIEGAFKVGHKLLMLHEGEIMAEGTPDDFRSSENPVVKQFITGSLDGPIKI